ncbi:hypothetical protein F7725_017983 [Dissostichus mawsoni]|uniref:Uncharacterized protein n=1 Tax=Dissostichus mawsoni TaxID=36200 RepID=A0A7J5XQ67_DISMA|nr:hypothetical protein F7725_017983 [Dissostichus mawsoni]
MEGRRRRRRSLRKFYVTLTISSLLLLTAVVITAKLCYDRSCSQHPPPLSRGVAPPLSLALPRSLAPEDSRQTLHSSSSSSTDRERGGGVSWLCRLVCVLIGCGSSGGGA